jgi:hypothetical protein
MDRKKGEVIINFMQQTPQFDSAGNVQSVSIETTNSMVMNRITAEELIANLNDILSEE